MQLSCINSSSMIRTNQNPDSLGALVSGLCLLHCVLTPVLFAAQVGSISCCVKSTAWWEFIDVIFLMVSFYAIYRSGKTTSTYFVKIALWLNWLFLLLVVINEKTSWFLFHKNILFFPGICLIILHLYSKKYCQCKNE